jgi:hypothetical protein
VDHLSICRRFVVDLSSICRRSFVDLSSIFRRLLDSLMECMTSGKSRPSTSHPYFTTTLLPSSPGTCHPQPESIPTYIGHHLRHPSCGPKIRKAQKFRNPKMPINRGFNEDPPGIGGRQQRSRQGSPGLLRQASDTTNFIRAGHGEYLTSRGNRGPGWIGDGSGVLGDRNRSPVGRSAEDDFGHKLR